MGSKSPRWKTFSIDGNQWKIFFVPKGHRHLKKNTTRGPLDGVARFIPKHIYVRSDLPLAERRETLVHELLHVSTGTWPGEVEEAVVRSLSPRLTTILEQLLVGWPT